MAEVEIDPEGAPEDPEGRRLAGWLDSVTLEGAAEPVRVMLDGREGHQIYVRQVDPSDGDQPRVPLFEGDDFVVMQAIAAISYHLTGEVGRTDDYLVGTRVVPVRREPGHVFARSLRRGEADDGTRVHVRPGDSLTFEEGAVVAELDAIDDMEQSASEGGSVPLTPVLWTWLTFVPGRDEGHVRYLLAAARRLDEATRLIDQVGTLREQLDSQSGPALRRTLFALIGATEVAIVALGRVVDMAAQAPNLLGTKERLPSVIEAKTDAIREIRNAYEHIEDRAFGRVFKNEDPSVLTIFDHHELVANNLISCRGHSLDLATEVPQQLGALRVYFKTVAGAL